uniref:Acyltransferase 3 domain-containing protein n=2 Tax=Parascaris univalens TaxID=6257 RepID=A0A915AWV9_PARUN
IAGKFLNQWISNFLLTVDTFLVLGGTVNAYGFFRKAQGTRRKPSWSSFSYWLEFYRHRIVRLWPAYLYTLLGVMFLSSSHYHALWPELDPLIQCRQHWWENLLFISSLFENRCMQWTWYIGTEFIFYLLSPIFLLTLLRWKNVGLVLCASTILVSASFRAFAMIAYNLPPTQLGWNTPPLFNSNYMEHFSQMYIKPQYRIGPYIVGIVLGYYLVQLRNTNVKYSLKFVALGWIFSTTAGAISVYGLYPVLQGWDWPVYYIIYGSFHRTLFALAIAWIVFACHRGYGGIVNRLLSFPIFIPLSALCYSVYLSHMPIVFATFLQLPFPYKYVGKIPLLMHCVVRLFLAYILGLQCSLLSELPAINVERILLARKRSEQVKSISHNEHCLSSISSTT